jgi:omega-amidase
MQDLTVSLVQLDIFWENPERNIQHMNSLLGRQALGDVVILPEMFGSGFSMNVENVAQPMSGSLLQALRGWAFDHQKLFMGTIAVLENGVATNRLFAAFPDGKLQWYDKRHLFAMAKEDQFYTAGKERLIIDYLGWKICPLICYDLRFPVFSRNTDSYDLLIYVANWPGKRISAWDALLTARAIENQCYVVAVNRVGVDGNGWEFPGHSQIINPMGERILMAPPKEEIALGKISAQLLKTTRESLPFLLDRDNFELK